MLLKLLNAGLSSPRCPPSPTADLVQEYANNNTQWHVDFGEALQILLEHGYPDNHLVAGGEELAVLVDPTVITSQTTPQPTPQPTTTPTLSTNGPTDTTGSSTTNGGTTPIPTPTCMSQEDEDRAINATMPKISKQ